MKRILSMFLEFLILPLGLRKIMTKIKTHVHKIALFNFKINSINFIQLVNWCMIQIQELEIKISYKM